MSRNQRRYRKNENGVTKKQFTIILSVVAVVCLCVILLATSLTACSKEPADVSTPDSVVNTIDETTYKFAQGIYADSVHLGDLTYKEAREKINAHCESLVKDFEVIVTASNKEFKYTHADFSFTNNTEEVLLDAKNYNDTLLAKNETKSKTDKTFKCTVSVSEESVNAKVSEIAKEVDREAKNATIGSAENNDISFVKDSTGLKVDQTALAKNMVKEINKLLTGNNNYVTIEAKVEEIQPSLTYNDLNGKIELLSSFTTYSTNTADGNHNMALALAACNGSVIEPGETWSFNACTGNSNLTSLGYRPATVIIGGKLVPGIGGGLCQSSTTIYNAAIRTNMEIVERYCHYYQSTYADAGLDATIDYPYLDLKLKNPTDYPMYFQCYMSGRTLYCNIYGYQDPSFDEVKVSSSIYEANRKENYYKAEAERVFLKNGKEVWREQLPYSTYHYVAPDESATTTAPTEKPTKPPVKPTKPAKPATTAPPTEKPTDPVVTTPPVTTMPADPVEPSAPVVAPPVETTPIDY